MIISTVQSAAHGHDETLRVSFDLIGGPGNDAIGRSFLIAPAILLPFGFAGQSPLGRTAIREYRSRGTFVGTRLSELGDHVGQAIGLVDH